MSENLDELRARLEVEERERQRLRNAEVDEVIAEFPASLWGTAAGGIESSWFLIEAVKCFRYGLFAAALVCAHATCEKEVAGRMAHRSEVAPRGWERWGLGKFIEHAELQNWYTGDTRRLLKETNECRRGVYHFRGFSDPDSVFTRAYEREPWFDKDEIKARMHEELHRNALVAIRAAFAVRMDDEEEDALLHET